MKVYVNTHQSALGLCAAFLNDFLRKKKIINSQKILGDSKAKIAIKKDLFKQAGTKVTRNKCFSNYFDNKLCTTPIIQSKTTSTSRKRHFSIFPSDLQQQGKKTTLKSFSAIKSKG
jgi:hypothetical protein